MLVFLYTFYCSCIGLNKFFYSRQTKDAVNYCVLINKLLELMGDELIQLGKKQKNKCTADEQLY